MLILWGISDRRKILNFNQVVICNVCGQYGRYTVFMTYTTLTLFFIPTFRWNKHYFVQTSCCGSLYELDPIVGKVIARGTQVEIKPQDLKLVRSGMGFGNENNIGTC